MCVREGKGSCTVPPSPVWSRAPFTTIHSAFSSDHCCCCLKLRWPYLLRSFQCHPFLCLIGLTPFSALFEWLHMCLTSISALLECLLPFPAICECEFVWVCGCVYVWVCLACAVLYGCCAVPVWLLSWCCWCCSIYYEVVESPDYGLVNLLLCIFVGFIFPIYYFFRC